VGAQNCKIWMALVLIGIVPTSAQIGGDARSNGRERPSRLVNPDEKERKYG
jgi:hypothetical protein